MSSPPQERKAGTWLGLTMATGLMLLVTALPAGAEMAFLVRTNYLSETKEAIIFGAFFALVVAAIGGILFWGGNRIARRRRERG